MEVFGVRLVGINAQSGHKLLLTILFVLAMVLISRALRWLASAILPKKFVRVDFWVGQAVRLLTTIVLLVGLVSIWFDEPARLASAIGLASAGVAFALQRVITAVASYFILLRGNTFNVGDRIMMGGVRGDVIAMGLMQTTIMEMGEPPGEQGDAPSMWVHSRQYTGRMVVVTNDKIFDEPVYNYTKEFPYVWDEMHLPVSFKDDRHRAEQILLEVAAKHTVDIETLSEHDLQELQRRYLMHKPELKPRVFWRITDNWLELSVRFICKADGVRALKDAMSRDIMTLLDQAGIGIASGTYEIVGLPTIRVEQLPQARLRTQ